MAASREREEMCAIWSELPDPQPSRDRHVKDRVVRAQVLVHVTGAQWLGACWTEPPFFTSTKLREQVGPTKIHFIQRRNKGRRDESFCFRFDDVFLRAFTCGCLTIDGGKGCPGEKLKKGNKSTKHLFSFLFFFLRLQSKTNSPLKYTAPPFDTSSSRGPKILSRISAKQLTSEAD